MPPDTTTAPSPFDLGPVTTTYGAPSAFTGDPHPGVDIGVNTGTPISAFIGGTVTKVFQDAAGGIQVIVTTPEGFQQVYAHLAATAVQPGQNVGPSDFVGWSGATGHVTGPHLHYEVRTPAGGTMDPAAFLSEFANAITGGGSPPAATTPSSSSGGGPKPSAASLASKSGVEALVAGAGDFLFNLFNPASWAKVGLTIAAGLMIGAGVFMYVGALKGEAIAGAAGRLK